MATQPQLNFFPGGFGAGVVIRNVPIAQTNPGLVWWLSNNTTLPTGGTSAITSQRIPYVTGSDANPGTFSKPFASLNYAATQASPGDIIFVKPGHAEKISSATALTLATNNIAIVGFGGLNTRPTFTLDTANTSTINVTGNDISIQNCNFVANFLSIASLFTLTTAKNFLLQNCSFTDTSSILTFISIVTTDATSNHADGLSVLSCRWEGSTNTTATAMVTAGAIMDNMVIADNFVNLGVKVTSGALVTGDFLHTNGLIMRNIIYRLNTSGVIGMALDTTSAVCPSVIIKDNLQVAGQDLITQAAWTTTGGPAMSGNYSQISANTTVQAAIVPVLDS